MLTYKNWRSPMDFFDKIKDIERIYVELIGTAQEKSVNEIQEFREKQEGFLIELMNKRKSVGETTLETLKQKLNQEINKFQFNLTRELNSIEEFFEEKKENLENLIIKQLGFDFK